MTESIEYKELADKFYKVMKSYPYTHTPELLNAVKEYEKLHKPKMTRCAVGSDYLTEVLDYNTETYVLFWGRWYKVKDAKLFLVELWSTIDELNQAYEECKALK